MFFKEKWFLRGINRQTANQRFMLHSQSNALRRKNVDNEYLSRSCCEELCASRHDETFSHPPLRLDTKAAINSTRNNHSIDIVILLEEASAIVCFRRLWCHCVWHDARQKISKIVENSKKRNLPIDDSGPCDGPH